MSGKFIAWIRSSGVLHEFGYYRMWLLCKLIPPPPRGFFLPAWFAAKRPEGLLAVGGKLTADTLLFAYSKGIYPFYDEHPVEWRSCDPRMILFLEKMKLKKGLRPLLKSGCYRVTFDTAFPEVIEACREREWTWLIPERIAVAKELHEKGRAHSVEVWNADGELVGGIFGVDLGKLFLSESAFSREDNAMKVACAHLCCHLQKWGFAVNDVQGFEEYFRRLGYEEVPRRDYIRVLRKLVVDPPPRLGKWSADATLDVANWNPAAAPKSP